MNAAERIRVCACGNRLKPKQGKYCSIKCKGKYHKGPPRPNGFGFVMPIDRYTPRIGAGIQDYLDEYPKCSACQQPGGQQP